MKTRPFLSNFVPTPAERDEAMAAAERRETSRPPETKLARSFGAWLEANGLETCGTPAELVRDAKKWELTPQQLAFAELFAAQWTDRDSAGVDMDLGPDPMGDWHGRNE